MTSPPLSEVQVRAPVVDIHSHAMPLPLLHMLERDGFADLSRMSVGSITIDPDICGLNRGAPIPFPREQFDVLARIEAMDEAGVSVHAVSAPPFLFASESHDNAKTLRVVRESNNALAEFVAQAPDRLVGLATIPVGLEEAPAELRRCVDELGFVGATIGTYGGNAELDAPVNEDLWHEFAAHKVLVLVHPSRVSDRARLADYHLVQLLGYPVETSLAVSRLVFGGVLDRYDVRLCLAHGGGCLPGVAPRLDLGWHRKASAQVMKRRPSDYLRDLYYDTAVFDDNTLSRLIEHVGASNVLLGTDFPFDLADRTAIRSIRSVGLTEDQQKLLLGGNALRLLGNRAMPSTLHDEPRLNRGAQYEQA